MKQNFKLLIAVFLTIILMPLKVDALEQAVISVDKTELEAGDFVNVVVDLDYNKDLYAFTASLSFDENVFEVLDTKNFEAQDEWSDIVYNKENNKFALINKSGENKEHLMMIKLFVKDNPVAGETRITLNNLVGSNGSRDIYFTDVNKTLNIKGDKNVRPSYVKKEEIKQKDYATKTFKPFIIIGFVLFVVFIGIMILINTQFLKNVLFTKKDYRKPLTMVFGGLAAFTLIMIIILAVMHGNRGDVNDDGNSNYEDARDINEYLIDITKESDDNKDEVIINKGPTYNTTSYSKSTNKHIPKKNLDVNGDGKVTITDSALQTEETTNKTRYKGELKALDIHKYPNKNGNVTLNFEAIINPSDVKIREVYVNGEKLEVKENTKGYYVIVKAPNKAGIFEYTIDKIILDNGRELKVNDITFKVDVLKDVPKLEDFKYDEATQNISFKFKDDDKALKNVRIKIVDEETLSTVLDEELDTNLKDYSFKLDLNLGEVYLVDIIGDYDLDTNQLDNNKNDVLNYEFYNHFIINGTTTIKAITDLDNLYPIKGKGFDFVFDAIIKPAVEQKVVKVIIDGEEKEVLFKDGHYVLPIEGSLDAGVKNHEISAIILDDDKMLLCDFIIEYDVLKTEPTISDFMYHNEENKITFKLNDLDKVFKDAKIVITKKDSDEVVFTEELDTSKTDFLYNVNLQTGAKYDVKIIGSYDLDSEENGKNEFEGALFTHELTIYGIKLSHALDEVYYANKEEEISLKFKALVTPEDLGSVVTKVIIDKEEYDVSTDSEGNYFINIKASKDCGMHEYTIDKVIVGDNEFSDKLTFKVDVLKDKPTLKNIFIDESVNPPVLSFDLIDNDLALDDNPGEVIIKSNNGKLYKKNITKGENKIDLNDLVEGNVYYLDIKVNYDLDSEKNNKHEESILLEKDHEIKLYKANLKLADSNNLYPKKDEIVPVNIEAKITPNDAKIKEFIMKDGTPVVATYNEQNDNYTINIHTPKESGNIDYKITKLILDNNNQIGASLSFSFDVLKTIPYINNFNFDEENGSVSFDLVDIDNALENGTYSIFRDNDKAIIDAKLNDSNIVTHEFLEDQIYSVKVVGSYNLDSNLNDDKYVYNNKEIFEHNFLIGGDYNFSLTDVSITDDLQQNEIPTVTFISTNTRGEVIKKANLTVNGITKDYDVIKVSDNNYEIKLDGASMSLGKHNVTLNNVELSNGKKFENLKDYTVNTLEYNVLKEIPTVSDIILTNNKEDKTITVNYKINDKDNAFSKVKVVLVDSTNKIILERELTKDELYLSTPITLSYKDNNDNHYDGRYKVKFLADYELGGKYVYSDKNVGEGEILTQEDDIYIKNIEIEKNNFYPVKGQKQYYLYFDVFVGDSINDYAKAQHGGRAYQKVSVVTINGVDYNADQNSGYKSRITLNVPNEAGILNLTVDRVQLQYEDYNVTFRNYYSVPLKSIKIDVLKDVPKIENLEITNEDYAKDEVTFDFDVILDKTAQDNDQSFINGTINLGDNSLDITRGHNTKTFKGITLDQNLDLIFKATYDLDTNLLDGDNLNLYNDKEIYKVKYGLFNKDTYDSIKIIDGEVISKNGNNYFEKNEKIKLNFKIAGLSDELAVEPQKVIIKDKEYTLTKVKDSYEIVLDGYNTFGVKDIEITDIVLNNGRKVTLNEAYTFKPEVLKDVVKITDYNYEIINDKIKLTFDTKDYDGSLVGEAIVKIVNDKGIVILEEPFKKEIEFDKDKDVLTYLVTITGDYDRDTNIDRYSENYNKDVLLLDEAISLEKNNIELKNITDINLYKKENDEIINMDEVDINDLEQNKDQYFVQVNMENLPSIYVQIKEIKKDNNELILVLDYDYVTKENSKGLIEIYFGSIKDNKAINETHLDVAFKALLERLKKGESVKLTQNYDASNVKVDGDYYVEVYANATFDGNGFKIKNLEKPLFGTLANEAKVQNLTLENVILNKNGRGALASEAKERAVAENIIIDGVTKTVSSDGRNGGLFGNTTGNVSINNCGVKNVNLNINGGNYQQNGGLVGRSENTKITNSYAIGKVAGSSNFNAGLVANATGCTIENSYAKVTVSGPISCNFTCSYNGNSILKNNVSLGTNAGSFSNGINASSVNNYQLVNEKSESNIASVKNILKEDVNTKLFNDALFSNDIWRLDNITYDNTPIFKYEPITDLNYKDNQDFNEENINLYNNLMKLMPFYDSDKIIESAKNITDSNLINKTINHIVPLDKNGNIVTYVTKDDVKKIKKIKIVYKTKEKVTYDVVYSNTYDMVASYHISKLKIDYNYNHYVIDSNSLVVNNLTNYLKKLNYNDNLDILTTTEDSRILRDYYNDNTSKELKEFVLKFLANSNYTNTSNKELINDLLEKEVKEDKKIEKVLYVYNYLKRFYDLEIDGMKLYDFILFNMQGFNKNLTPLEIANLFLKDGNNFKTNQTNNTYVNIFSSYTNLSDISTFLEYMVTEFGDGDLDKWTASQFKGLLAEVSVDEDPNVLYTLWDHFSNKDKKYGIQYNFILPILTLPENAAYIISTPTQYIIGAQRGYVVDPNDPDEQAYLQRKVDSYTKRMKDYYNTAYSILEDPSVFNDIHTYQIDKRMTKDENGGTLTNTPYATEEPFHKNFNEVIGSWAYADGNAATANGLGIIWRAEGLMDGNLVPGDGDLYEYTFQTWAHETAHNMDARLFLKDNGRRFDAGGEDYADGNLTQAFGKNDIVMNLSIRFGENDKVGANRLPSRINSKEDIYDYYNKLFKTIYVMDYIEAKAFLLLTPEEQSKVGIKVSYPNESKYIGDDYSKYRAYQVSAFEEKDAQTFENMHLTSIDDLIDNKIMLYPGVYKYSSRGSNSYGGEGLAHVHWYQPNNPYGRPDSYALKWIAYEMLGYAGYQNGYIEYYSNIHSKKEKIYENVDAQDKKIVTVDYKTDNMALKKITNYNNMDQYKKARFKEVEDNLQYLNKAINVDKYVKEFYDALVKDAEYRGRRAEEIFKAWGKDERGCLDTYWCRDGIANDARSYKYSNEVRQEIFYTLKDLTNDFIDDIYEEDVQQDIGDFDIKAKVDEIKTDEEEREKFKIKAKMKDDDSSVDVILEDTDDDNDDLESQDETLDDNIIDDIQDNEVNEDVSDVDNHEDMIPEILTEDDLEILW